MNNSIVNLEYLKHTTDDLILGLLAPANELIELLWSLEVATAPNTPHILIRDDLGHLREFSGDL